MAAALQVNLPVVRVLDFRVHRVRVVGAFCLGGLESIDLSPWPGATLDGALVRFVGAT